MERDSTSSVEEFTTPEEWLTAAGIEVFAPSSLHYAADLSSGTKVVPLGEIEPPFRDNGKRWFRNRESVVEVLRKMRTDEHMEPIEVWSKGKKSSDNYIVRDGFHRYYLSVAVGYRAIPIIINDFDMDEFFEKEKQAR